MSVEMLPFTSGVVFWERYFPRLQIGVDAE
jgi:hypothetical protein